MSVTARSVSPSASLSGRDGELILVSVSVRPQLLERLLETLAELPYHINPQIRHHASEGAAVEFPAYEGWLPATRRALAAAGLAESVRLLATPMFDTLALPASL